MKPVKKQKLNLKLTYGNKTHSFSRQSRDGFIVGFPQESPLCHLTALFEKERFSIHATKDNEIGNDRYETDNRVEIKFDDKQLQEHFNQHDWTQYLEECQVSKLPGKLYLGGYFHSLRNEVSLQDRYLSMEDLFSKLYIVKGRHLRFYQEKMWLVLSKERGKNGRWHDIGLLYGPFNNRIYYLSYGKIGALLNMLAKIFRTTSDEAGSLEVRESRIIWDIDKKTQNIIMGLSKAQKGRITGHQSGTALQIGRQSKLQS